MVAIFLLRAGRQPQIRRGAPGGDEAGDPRAVQGRRSLRQRAGTGSAPAGRWRVHPALRLRAADAEREPLWQWREYDAEDSMRFYALRLHELGMIKKAPQ